MSTPSPTLVDAIEALNLLTAADVWPCRLEDIRDLILATGPQIAVVEALWDLDADGRSMASTILLARHALHPYLEAEADRLRAQIERRGATP